MRPDEIPDASSFGKTRARLAQLGLKPAQVNQATGSSVGGRTRREIARQSAAALATLRKG